VVLATTGSTQHNFIELSGDLPSILTAESPYLVVGDIYVSPGSITTIEPGAVLLFTEFTGLHIQGTLYARGTPDKNIYFTSQYDPNVNPFSPVAPAPFDWNGIDVYDGAVGTEFLNCGIRYSVYGIRSQTEHIKIVSSIFSNNGRSDFNIKDVKREVEPDTPFSYNYSQNSVTSSLNTAPVVDSLKHSRSPELGKLNSSAEQNKRFKGVQILRYSGLLLGVGSGAFSIVTLTKAYKPAAEEFEKLSELDEVEMRTYSSQDWIDSRDRRNKALAKTLIGAASTVLGFASFSISFAF